ncbi:MAG: radical SAM protein [Polyangiaceae bacterium]|nr:radical SAM protein [Polyangiaceae bacterium]
MVADDEPWIRAQLPDADEFVPGLAESTIESIVAGPTVCAPRNLLRAGTIPLTLIPELNYALLDCLQDFQPSIEVSRGCGMHCTFCAEAEEPLGNIKSPRLLADEFAYLAKIFGADDIHPYLEASFFRPTTNWTQKFEDALHRVGVTLQWRAETRVDAISPKQLEQLARTGLRVLDLGLESASPRQLRAMRKTTQPDVYLRRASQLLRACESANVWAKVNVLLHPGETMESINETVNWLEAHRSSIKGLSVGPTILFRYGRGTDSLLQEFRGLGAFEVRPGSLDEQGFAHFHLSAEIPHDMAVTLSRDISRSFMSARDYFDLKSFSYLPRSFKWNDFYNLVTTHNNAEYPFRFDELNGGVTVR